MYPRTWMRFCVFSICLAAVFCARIKDLDEKEKDKGKKDKTDKILRKLEKGKTVHGFNGKLGHDMRVKKQKKDDGGSETTTFQQEFEGMEVMGCQINQRKGRGKKNKIGISGAICEGIEEDVGAIDPSKLNPTGALKKMKDKRDPGKPVHDEHCENIIFIDKKNGGKAKVAHKCSYRTTEPDGTPKNPVSITDVEGNSLMSWDDTQYQGSDQRVGTGPGGNEKTKKYVYGSNGVKKMLVKVDGATCSFDTTNVKVIDLKHATSCSPCTPFSFACPENTVKTINGAYSPLNDANHFGTVVYDMYWNRYGEKPIESLSHLTFRVHYSNSYSNAFWDGSTMTFGDGGGSYHPLVSLDVVAHEVSHGVTQHGAGLVYSGQSGGMNEAFSDMAGKAAEFVDRGKIDSWGIGYDINKASGAAMRWMNNPPDDGRSIGHIKDYKDMDVHYSSGLYNKVYYTLSTKTDWDPQLAFDVFYVANTKGYWTNRISFVDGAKETLKAAEDMKKLENGVGKYFKRQYQFDIQAIVDSFAVVGICCSKPSGQWICGKTQLPSGACHPDPCSVENPCLNGGACNNEYNYGFQCTCPAGTVGNRCHDDQCKPTNPCTTPGKTTCVTDQTDGSYTCTCTPGKIGPNCEYYDMVVSLVSPAGTTIVMMKNRGGSGDNLVDTIFDQQATTAVSAGSAPFTGSFKPEESLDTLNNQVGNGDWTLKIEDTADQDGGTLKNWKICLRIEQPNDACTPNPCQAGGSCQIDGSGFKCTCTPGRFGDTCQLKRGCFTSGAVNLAVGPNSGVNAESTINVATAFTLTDVDVEMNVDHTYLWDIIATLTHPDGTAVKLVHKAGGSGDNFVKTVFDDSATTAVASGAAPFTGSYKPQESLASLNQKGSAGAWKIKVEDTYNYDGGQLKEWKICLTS